jgi:hypothetical protein
MCAGCWRRMATIQRGEADLVLAGRTFRITRQFLDDLTGRRVARAIGELRSALIVFHSPSEIVAIDNARQIFEAARHPKSFVALAGPDHLLSDPDDALCVARVLSAWSSRLIGESAEESVSSPNPRPRSRGLYPIRPTEIKEAP